MLQRCLITLSILLFMASFGEASRVPCESFSSSSLDTLSNLRTCYMQASTVIDDLNFEISSEKSEDVLALRLNGNKKILYLPLNAYKKFPNLLGYGGHECSVKLIRKENFHNLNKLRVIYLWNNQITTIFSDTFEGLTSLERIDLDRNQIMRMDGELFAGLNKLRFVDLDDNSCINQKFKDRSELAHVVSAKCGFSGEIQRHINKKLDLLMANTSQQFQDLKLKINDRTELSAAKVAHDQCKQLLSTAKSEITDKVAAIATLEAGLKASKRAQSQAESQILLVRDLSEKLYSQLNQTCNAKTGELQNLIEFKMRENYGASEELQSLRADVRTKDEKIRRLEEKVKILSE